MTNAGGRPSASGRSAAILLASALLAALAAATLGGPALAQESEDIGADIERYRGILAVAKQSLEDLELPEALARFTEVIDGYQAGRLSAANPIARPLVGQALEGRARTFANLARPADAEKDFEALIRFDPAWPIDRERTSPKIVAIFDKVRARLIGALTVEVEPPGAALILNDEPAGRAPQFDRELPAGVYTLRVEAPGFEPAGETITLTGGQKLARTYTLVPNARGLLVVTSPPGARITVDDRPLGSTFGTAGPEYAEAAAELGLALADLSGPLLVEHLAPGTRLLRVEKDCFQPQLLSVSVALDPADPSPIRLQPVRLNPSVGALSVDSTPPGAEVLLDGEPAGKTPLKKDGLCSGSHALTVRLPGVAQWIGSAEVTRGATVTVNAPLRMTLAFLGMTEAGAGGQPLPEEAMLAAELAKLKPFNVVTRTNERGPLDPKRIEEAAAETGADLVAVALPASGAFERKAILVVHAARFPSLSMSLPISLDSAKSIADALATLDSRARLTRPWLGLRVMETRKAPNPTVLTVAPDGPAGKAGVVAGDTVVSLGGRPVARGSDLAAALTTLAAGANASLMLQSGAQPPRQVNVTLSTTPVVDPSGTMGGRPELAALRAAELAHRARMEKALGRDAGPERTSALMNLAVILMKAGQPEAALAEALNLVEAPAGAGVSAGTTAWLKAQCLSQLGRGPQARQELEKAAGQEAATLWSHDGPPVAERAKRQLSAL